MTCKNCLCYRACHFHIDEETCMTVNECSTGFMPKDQYVKMPAYIGQPVWVVNAWCGPWGHSVEVKEGKVSMLQQKADKSWKFRVSHSGYVVDFKPADWGVGVFSTEAEAQAFAKQKEKEFNEAGSYNSVLI